MADRMRSIDGIPFNVHDKGETPPRFAHDVHVSSGSMDLIVSDLQIGAVEIKDHDSAIRLDVETVTNKNAAYDQSEDGAHVTMGALADAVVAAGAAGSISAKLRRISSDLDAAKTAVETIENAISGNEMQADIVTQPAAEQTTPTFYNLTLAGADTEYVQALPANTRALQFQCRTENDIRYAFETGKVATPTAPYSTLKAGDVWYKENILTSGSLYVASSTAGVITEIEAWS